VAKKKGGGGGGGGGRRSGGFLAKIVPVGTLPVGGGVLAGLIVPDWIVSKIEKPETPFADGTRLMIRLGIAGGLALLIGRFFGRWVALGVVAGAIAREAQAPVRKAIGMAGLSLGDPDAVPTLGTGNGMNGLGSYGIRQNAA
jgi:hypothetical protein